MADQNKSLFRRIRDWAEETPSDGYADIFGSNSGKQEKDYSDIFGSRTGKQERDYSDIFGKPESAPGTVENPVTELTFEDVAGFYYEMLKVAGNIRQCVLYIVEKKNAEGHMIYCVNQYFKDSRGRIVYSADNPDQRLERTVYAETLDEELENSFRKKNPFEL